MEKQTIGNWISDDVDLPIHQQLLLASVYLLAFVIPFSGLITSYSIVISVLCLIISAARSSSFKIKWNNDFILLPAFYCIGCLSMIYSKNQQSGWSVLGTEFSLLLLPVFFLIASSLLQLNVRKIMWSFITGCFIASIICLGYAYIQFIRDNDLQNFFYKKLSIITHPGYYAMYLNFAVAYLGWELLTGDKRALLSNFLLVFFSLVIILLSSKLAIILLFLSLFAFFVTVIFQKRKDKFNCIVRISILSIIVVSALFLFKASSSRFNSLGQVANYSSVKPSTTESTGLRLEVWKAALSIVKQNWLIGVGVGGTQDALQKRYTELGITDAAEQKLNAHNQYLQTFLGTGIIGLLLLLVITVGAMIKSVFNGRHLLAIFLFIITLNFCIEAVLQREAGVIFFSFFYSSLLLTGFNKSKT